MPRREPRRTRIIGDASQPDRVRVVDQRPQQALALRQMPDPLDGPRRHAHMHELGQPSARRDHPERRVLGTDQVPRRLRDPPQHHRERQVPDHHLVRPQQTSQPALGGHHLLCPLHQLREQLVQLQARKIREGQRTGLTPRCPQCPCPTFGGQPTRRVGVSITASRSCRW
jgi:hypothetical protein